MIEMPNGPERGALDLGELPSEPARGIYVQILKPLLDFVGALLGLIFFAPAMILIALIVALESRGGVFFRQERIGFLGRPFHLIKFRTMVAGAEHQGSGVLVRKDDPRVTRVGRWLRAASLDELPQLVNVLR